MAKDTDIKLNSRGMQEMLRSRGVANLLKGKADRIAAAAGPGHQVFVTVGSSRARAAVVTVTAEAMVAEASDRRLSMAFNAGRG